ncbi:2-keto-myo-inositol isomerase [Pseudorhizobium tarimense]|uniref:2-keto-myo-inositol isomerase n=1 Tax=Pseudorhizobium tarimense TaxID=1079109 RepID=A0ABV2HD54_9HYPH|nr:TIM barrel protein [Pseudorhizobium tarimense]MCJ8521541.1 TIM barrel protein [Pseudorhizobium tarimense]
MIRQHREGPMTTRMAVPFALNHITAPRLTCHQLIDLASELDCVGVELRDDLIDKKLSDHALFGGEDPAAIGAYARERSVRLLGLSEIYGFNKWSPEMADKVRSLVAKAERSGAESISLIPRNDAPVQSPGERAIDLRTALAAILPILAEAGILALIEPLGFTTSSLKYKREAVEAIKAVGGKKHYRLVHDTFHHHLAGESEYFPEYTGIVHISGVSEQQICVEQMRDEHRILVDEEDRLRNVDQIRDLTARGYAGPFSYEAFSPVVHASAEPEQQLGRSFAYLRSALH